MSVDAKKTTKPNVAEFITTLPSDSPLLQTSFSGIATFMHTPFYKNFKDVDIALVGVPFDGGTTNRPGARLGPREIRNQSTLMGFQNYQSKIIPYEKCRIGDIGDVPIAPILNLETAMQEIETFYHHLAKANVIPITAGGDHSISYPILKALGAQQPLGLIHIDSHCNTAPKLYGNKFQHGSPFYQAVQAGVLDPKRTIQIGIRGPHEYLWDFSYQSGMRVIHMDEFYDMGLKAVIAEARKVVGNAPTYISFDVDGLDPAFAPGTGTPEIGGLTSFEGQQLLRGLHGLNPIGGDVVEVSPPFDPSGCTALVGATLMFEILCLIADKFTTEKS
jgi:agmatinase